MSIYNKRTRKHYTLHTYYYIRGISKKDGEIMCAASKISQTDRQHLYFSICTYIIYIYARCVYCVHFLTRRVGFWDTLRTHIFFYLADAIVIVVYVYMCACRKLFSMKNPRSVTRQTLYNVKLRCVREEHQDQQCKHAPGRCGEESAMRRLQKVGIYARTFEPRYKRHNCKSNVF